MAFYLPACLSTCLCPCLLLFRPFEYYAFCSFGLLAFWRLKFVAFWPLVLFAFLPFCFVAFWPFGLLAFWPLGLWAFGPLGLWAFGPVGLWAFGPLGLSPCGPLGLWAFGPLGLWAFGLLAFGPLGLWAFSPLGLWALWPFGPSAFRPFRLSAFGPFSLWGIQVVYVCNHSVHSCAVFFAVFWYLLSFFFGPTTLSCFRRYLCGWLSAYLLIHTPTEIFETMIGCLGQSHKSYRAFISVSFALPPSLFRWVATLSLGGALRVMVVSL